MCHRCDEKVGTQICALTLPNGFVMTMGKLVYRCGPTLRDIKRHDDMTSHDNTDTTVQHRAYH